MAEHDRKEHQQSKIDLAALEKMSVEDAEFDPMFEKLFRELEEHMNE